MSPMRPLCDECGEMVNRDPLYCAGEPPNLGDSLEPVTISNEKSVQQIGIIPHGPSAAPDNRTRLFRYELTNQVRLSQIVATPARVPEMKMPSLKRCSNFQRPEASRGISGMDCTAYRGRRYLSCALLWQYNERWCGRPRKDVRERVRFFDWKDTVSLYTCVVEETNSPRVRVLNHRQPQARDGKAPTGNRLINHRPRIHRRHQNI